MFYSSILLRGFDQQIASKIGEYMEEHGVNFIRECVPVSLEKVRKFIYNICLAKAYLQISNVFRTGTV